MCEFNPYVLGGGIFGAGAVLVFAVWLREKPSFFAAGLAAIFGFIFLFSSIAVAWLSGEPFPQVLMFCVPAETAAIAIGLGQSYALLLGAMLYWIAAAALWLGMRLRRSA